MNKLKFCFVLIFLLNLTIFALHASTSEKPDTSTSKKPLVIGTACGYAPFVSLNDNGEYEGFDIDVAKAIAKKLGRPLKIVNCGNMPSMMLSLKQKKVDLLIWALSITDARQKKVEMVYYQGEKIDSMPFVFWGEVPKNIKTIPDLVAISKKPICVEAGSFQEDIIKACPNFSIKYLDKVTDVILDLKYGKSFTSCIDPSLVPTLQKKYPQLKTVYLPLLPEFHSSGNGICIHKEEQEFAKKISTIVQEMINNKEIAELEKKWGLSGAE
jgi:ABC-type amino acid transport substrate-binding protein